MEFKLLTQQDLSKRWQVSVKAIECYRKEGIISPVQGIPSIRFNPQHISEIEKTNLQLFSPIERRKLENDLEALRKENEKLKEILSKMLSDLAPIINLK